MAFYHDYLIVFGFIIRPIGSKRDILISTTTLRAVQRTESKKTIILITGTTLKRTSTFTSRTISRITLMRK